MTTPVPPGRGRWRLTLHNRDFSGTAHTSATGIGELVSARGRRLDQVWNSPAQLTFTVNGKAQAAAQIIELATDVCAWRWSESKGNDVLMFRGIIAQAEDELTEQSHTVTLTCHDYLAMLGRRYITSPTGVTWLATDQDQIAVNLIAAANHPLASSGADVFYPGSRLPFYVQRVNPDGTNRPFNSPGILRDRTYLGSQEIGAALDDLARVIGGFDYDYYASSDTTNGDQLRIFYPVQGVTRSDMALVYGSNVAAVTRTVNSGDYSNYVRVLGNNASSDPAAPQMYAEAWNADANNVTVNPVGLWMTTDNASDVSIQSTLNEKAQGDLAIDGVLMPSYTLTMRPGTYHYGSPNMGDTVPLVIQSGRLKVSTTVRVLGISYDIGDDGQEDVELTVGRPAVPLASIFGASSHDIDALARR
jgi:hypothetical protein